jgi:hypothetical protein
MSPLEALDNSQSLLVMLYHLAECNNDSIPNKEWESEKLATLLAEQIAENRKALSTVTRPNHASEGK